MSFVFKFEYEATYFTWGAGTSEPNRWVFQILNNSLHMFFFLIFKPSLSFYYDRLKVAGLVSSFSELRIDYYETSLTFCWRIRILFKRELFVFLRKSEGLERWSTFFSAMEVFNGTP